MKLRKDYIVPVLLSLAIAIGLVRVGVETRTQNDSHDRLSCQNARNQREQLVALEDTNMMLRAIIRELGLPVPLADPIMIPEVPAICDGS